MNKLVQNNIYIFITLFVGIFLRIFISKQGYNYDFPSYRIYTDLFQNGEDFYITGRYNYAPVWINVLAFLDSLPSFNLNSFDSLRIKVVSFLSLIDIFIFLILNKLHSFKVAILFYLSPISIFITGFHNQFDVLAIFIGFFAILIYEKNHKNLGFFVCALLLGLSLCVKHVLFLLPFWLAFKEKNFLKKIFIIFIPYSIFLISFLSYVPEHLDSIIKNVFFYSSWDNGPFWGIFMPYFVNFFVPKKILFIISLILLGLFIHKKPIREIFYIYLIAMTVLSSAIANQYLAIPLIAIAVFWNSFYGIYTIACSLLFLVDRTALKIGWLSDLVNWTPGYSRYSYYVIIFFLSIGFLKTLIGEKEFNKLYLKILKMIRLTIFNIKEQFTSNKW